MYVPPRLLLFGAGIRNREEGKSTGYRSNHGMAAKAWEQFSRAVMQVGGELLIY